MSSQESSRLDPWSAVVIALTLVLFVVSIFVKGFTHELLLEAGVFLVSIKLILMAQRTACRPNSPLSAWSKLPSCWRG